MPVPGTQADDNRHAAFHLALNKKYYQMKQCRKNVWLCRTTTVRCLRGMMLLIFGWFLMTGEMFAQGPSNQTGITVTGTVFDEFDTALTGVTISVDGTSIGIITDIEGRFSLVVPSEEVFVKFRFIGYQTQLVNVGKTREFKIKLQPTNMDLEEVVVIGYGEIKKKDLTGSVSSIKADEIVKLPTHNPVEALQGRIPGMDIVRSSGNAGADVNITIRGNRSINGENSPLFIIDGIQGGSYSDLNQSDIESMEVLKDASSTAIYGSKGANGVVIITTKKGLAGKTKVSYDGYYGINGIVDYPSPLTGDAYLDYVREGKVAAGTYTSDEAMFTADVWAAIQAGQWVDWTKLLLHDGSQQSHTVSLKGGNEKTKLYMSFNYFEEVGMLTNDNMERFIYRTNVNHGINKWASIGMNTQLTYSEKNARTADFGTAISARPLGTPYAEDGSVIRYPIAGDQSTLSPLLNETDDYTQVNNTLKASIVTKAFLEIKPMKGLTYRSNLSTTINASRQGKYDDTWSLATEGEYNEATATTSGSLSLMWDNILTYNQQLGDHDFGGTVLSSWSKNSDEYYTASGLNIAVPNQLFYNLDATEADGRSIYSEYTQSQMMSIACRLNYSYKGRYLFQVSERLDGSSVLPKHWCDFPSISGGWRISDESFMEDLAGTLTNLKFRASYGMTGNDGIAAYGTQSLVIADTRLAFGETAATYYYFGTDKANTDLEWEMSETIDLGFDFGLWNRINGTIDIYQTLTSGVLYERSSVPSAGGGGFTTWQNVCSTSNKGIELMISSDNIRKKHFKWSTTYTFSTNKEEITGLLEGTDILSGEDNSLLLGHEISSYRCYEKLGIWQLGEEEAAALYNCEPGDIKIKDQITEDTNGDGIADAANGQIDEDDYVYIGSKNPKWQMGLNNTFELCGFDLSFFFNVRWGQVISSDILGRYKPSASNIPSGLDYWTETNPSNDFPRPNALKELSSYTGYQALKYTDGSYIKLKTINFGYTLPKKMSDALSIERLRVYATGSNLWYWAKSHLLNNYDPERGGSEDSPLGRQLVMGINLTF